MINFVYKTLATMCFYIIFELLEHIIFQLFGVCVGMENDPQTIARNNWKIMQT